MRYVVYADVMLLYDFFINTAVLIIASKLMHICIKLKRLILWAFITSILSTAVYILFWDNIFLPLFYALIYLFMTIMYFKTTSLCEALKKILTVIISMPVIYGIINIFTGGESSSLAHILISLTLGILVLLFTTETFCHKLSGKYQSIILIHSGKKYKATGYLDTGNSLRDPFINKPVMIADNRIINKITGNKVSNLLNMYRSTGYMDYEEFTRLTDITLHPVPYSTINSSCEFMPVLIIDSMSIVEEKKKYTNIALGISRHKLKNDYQILLNEKLITI